MVGLLITRDLFKDRREDLARRLNEVHADAAKGHLRAVPDQSPRRWNRRSGEYGP